MQVININNIITTQQLRIISHDSSKGENTPYYDIIVGTKGVSQNHLLSFDNNKVLKIINWTC